MYRYADARFGAEERFGGIAASAFAPTGDLPPFLMAQLLFPYMAGERVRRRGCSRSAAGDWTVVDTALRFRPPASTEQIMHPQAYLRGRAARARVACAGRRPRSARAGASCAAGRSASG